MVTSANESAHEQVDGPEARSQPFLETFWNGLVADPGTGIAIIRIDGRLLYMNDANLLFWTPSGEPTMKYEGRTVHQNVPLEYADHVMGVVRTVIEQRKTMVDRTIWRGKQLKTTARFLEPPSGELPRILAVTRHVTGTSESMGEESEFDVVEPSVADLGPLAVLSARELEVLALIGQGLRLNDIAKVLCRSPKTIGSHRVSIGRKLFPEGSNRVDLAKLVFDAGLRLDDAQLRRVNAESPRQP